MSERGTLAICDFLGGTSSPDLRKAIGEGRCPDCGAEKLVRWVPQTDWHELCTHYHCLACDADFCYPIAWDPPLGIIRMRGTLPAWLRKKMEKEAKQQGRGIE